VLIEACHGQGSSVDPRTAPTGREEGSGRNSWSGRASGVILADLIFKSLAIAVMAGEIASLLIRRLGVPMLY
jgi:hypothetical protein